MSFNPLLLDYSCIKFYLPKSNCVLNIYIQVVVLEKEWVKLQVNICIYWYVHKATRKPTKN